MQSLHFRRLLMGALLLWAQPLWAEIRLSHVFSPHMVLQREMQVPIWGSADAGELVQVRFRNQVKNAIADKNGKWSVQLDPLRAGGPDVLTIGERAIKDVLVGEVWVGAGQSNMDLPVSNFVKNDSMLEVKAASPDPKIRLLRKEADDLWQEATPENVQKFSALLFSFGAALQRELKVPVGLIMVSVSGTSSAYWLSEEMYRNDPACAEAVQKFAPKYPALLAQYEEAKARYDKEHDVWAALAELALTQKKALAPEPNPPRPLGKLGEANSGKVGSIYERWIRPHLLGYGIKGVLWDQGESGTNIVGLDTCTLMGALISGWRREWGQGDFPFLYVQKPSGGGPAWDYDDPVTAKADKFVADPGTVPSPPPTDYGYEGNLKIMQYPNTFMVTSTDLGGGTHPENKSGYGARAARVALGAAYGQNREIYGPLYASHRVFTNVVELTFTHKGKGLAFKNGTQLQGFMVAGEDRKFVWAVATVHDQKVVVWNNGVPKPVAVRYAWASTFPWANLFNKDGLPAQPFRTDDW